MQNKKVYTKKIFITIINITQKSRPPCSKYGMKIYKEANWSGIATINKYNK